MNVIRGSGKFQQSDHQNLPEPQSSMRLLPQPCIEIIIFI